MKLKTLAALCKKAGVFYLYDHVTPDGEVVEQWLGDGGAVFPLYGLPYMQESNLFTLFDITDKQRKKIFFRHERLPEAINFKDTDANETILDREKLTVGHAGKVLRPLQTGWGLVFIDTAQLSPLADLADTLELYERQTESGVTYIAAKKGFMLMKATSEAQAKANKRRLIDATRWKLNANFRHGDLHTVFHHSENISLEEADACLRKVLRLIRSWCRENGVKWKYAAVTEVKGKAGVNIHHHMGGYKVDISRRKGA